MKSEIFQDKFKTCHFYIKSKFKLIQASWTFSENQNSKVQAFSRTKDFRQVGIAWIFLKSKFISKSKKIQVNPRLESLDYFERTWKY